MVYTSVLRNLPASSLTRALIMDHMDWFDSERPKEVEEEVEELVRVLSSGGMVFWRSAARRPWYNDVFERMGFKLEALGVREKGKAMDRVNMYASFWRGVKA